MATGVSDASRKHASMGRVDSAGILGTVHVKVNESAILIFAR